MFKKYFIGCIALTAILIFSCGMPGTGPETENSELTIRVVDNMLSRSIMPGISLDAERYAVHGAGTSGRALGATFDLDIFPGGGTATMNLLPGDWTITVMVWNDDDPSAAVGEGLANITMEVGVPQTIIIPCLPYEGEGTLNINLSWLFDVSSPYVQAEVQTFGSSAVDFPMSVPVASSSSGSALLPQGWKIGFIRVYENDEFGELVGGIARTLRIAANATTTWDEVLTDRGEVTLGIDWQSGPPLILTTEPAGGEVILLPGETKTFEVTGADNDPETSLIYCWYVDGVATVLSTLPSFVLDSADYEISSQHYVSAAVFQDNGRRGADAQWIANMNPLPPEAYAITFDVDLPAGSNVAAEMSILNESFEVVATETKLGAGTLTHTFVDLEPGNYYLKAQVYSNTFYRTIAGQTAIQGEADLLEIPYFPTYVWSSIFPDG